MNQGTATELAALLRTMRFSPTAAQIYARLVFGGPASPDKVRGTADAALFQAGLGELLRRRMVARGRSRGGPLIYAVDPGLSLTSLIAEVVWSRLTDLAPIDQLPETDDAGVEALRRMAGRALEIAQSAWSPADGVQGHKSTRAVSAKGLSVLCAESVLLARREVRSVSRRPRLPDVAFFWEAITSRMANGVAYRRVTDLHELVEHGLKVVERDMHETGVDLRVIEASRLDRGFYVIDRRYAIVYDPPPARDEPAQGGTLTTDRRQIERKRTLFGRLYDDAIPGEFAVAALRPASRALLRRAHAVLDAEGYEWLSELVGLGKFARDAPSELVEQHAREAGLVERNYTGHAVPVYDLSEVDLREAWEVHSNRSPA